MIEPHLLSPKLREAFERAGEDMTRHLDRFGEVERFCLFIGYPRSGCTIVASMLAAHPDAAIAIELDSLRYVAAGFDRARLFSLLLQRALKQSSPTSYEYSYAVPGQWQGRVRRLRVLGDKEAGMTNLRLRWEPDLLDRLRALVDVPLRVIHVARHPLDNITTMLMRGDADHLQQAVATYFRFAENAQKVLDGLAPEERFELSHDELIADPRALLLHLCAFLSLDAEPDYLDACASIVLTSPRLTRQSIEWPSSLLAEVRDRIRSIRFLRHCDISLAPLEANLSETR